jgi:hypothetical protein
MSPSGKFEDYCDTVQIGIDSESSFPTRAMPLISVFEVRFHLEEKVDSYMVENPYSQWSRRYRAAWVIEDNKLYFKDVEGSLEGSELSYQLLFSNYQEAEGNDGVQYECRKTRMLMIENGLVRDDKAIYEQEKYVEFPF